MEEEQDNLQQRVFALEQELERARSELNRLRGTTGQREAEELSADLQDGGRMQEALNTSELRFRTIFQNAAVGSVVVDAQGKFAQANDAFCRFIGYSEEELWHLTVQDVTASVSQEASRQALAGVLRGEQEHADLEKAYIRKDGSQVWGHVVTSLVRDAAGQPDFWIAQVMDITAHREDREALRTSERRFSTVYQSAEAGIALLEPQGVFLQANPAFCDIVGYSETELQQMTPLDLSLQTDKEYTRANMEKALEGKGPEVIHREKKLRCKDGQVVVTQLTISLVRDDRGAPLYWIALIQDISDHKRALEELRATQERLQFALDGAGDGVWDWHLPTNTVYLSPGLKQMVGYTDSEMQNSYEQFADLLHPDDTKRVMENIQAYLDDPVVSYENEFRWRCKDGSYKWILSRGKVLERDEDGKPLQMFGTHTDIDQLKKLQVELLQAKFIIDSSPMGICTVDKTGRITYMNHAGVEIFGRPVKEIVPCKVQQILTVFGEEGVWQKHWQEVAEAGTISYSAPYVRPDGRKVMLDGAISQAEFGGTVYNLAFFHDATPELEMAERLKESEEKYRRLFTAESDAILLLDLEEKRVTDCNPAATRLYGGARKGLIGSHLSDLLPAEERERSDVMELFSGGSSYLADVGQARRDGSTFPADISTGVFVWKGRQTLVAVVRNISKNKEVQALKEEMISCVSHEMRTPLTAVIGFAEFLLENEVDSAVQRDYLKIIFKETERLKDVIDNLLSLQRLRAGYGCEVKEEVVVFDLLDEVRCLFAKGSDKHELRLEVTGGMPSVLLSESYVHLALNNLVSNAIKYSPEGGEVVLGADSDDQHVRIWVRDQGLGLPADSHEDIFERYFRVSDKDHRKISGTGLGLPLVKEVLRAHKGRVWVESSVGRGATFFLEFPRNP